MIGPGAVGVLPMGVLPTGNLPIGALPSTGCGGGGWERGRSAAAAALTMAREAAAAIESLSIGHPSLLGDSEAGVTSSQWRHRGNEPHNAAIAAVFWKSVA